MTAPPRSLFGHLSDGLDWLIEKAVAPLDRMEMTALTLQQARDRKEMTELGIISAQAKSFEPAVIVVAPHRSFTKFGLNEQESTGFLPVAHIAVAPAKTLTF
jgi:hypothetical protein